MDTTPPDPSKPDAGPPTRNFGKQRRPATVPRFRYSAAADGWVLVGFSPKSHHTLVPSASGFNLITAQVRGILLTIAFVTVAVSAAFTYDLYSSPCVLRDFLSYVLPCLAGILGGLGIFYPKLSTSLFFTSAMCLAAGIYFYIEAHSHIAVIRLMSLTGSVVVTSLFMLWVNVQRQRHDGGGTGWRISNVAYFVVVIAALGLAYVVIGILPMFSMK